MVLTEAIIAARGLKLLHSAGGWLERYRDGKLVEARRELFEDFVVELVPRLLEAEQRLAAAYTDAEALRARVAELESRGGRTLLDNCAIEAQREPIDERRRMLAYAAAGGGPTCLSVAQLSRAERTIRELDPTDVLVLADLGSGGGDARGATAVVRSRWPSSYSTLRSAGCVARPDETWDGMHQLAVTPAGAAVLEVLADYVTVRRHDLGTGWLPAEER
jgi:hypothetical protein